MSEAKTTSGILYVVVIEREEADHDKRPLFVRYIPVKDGSQTTMILSEAMLFRSRDAALRWIRRTYKGPFDAEHSCTYDFRVRAVYLDMVTI